MAERASTGELFKTDFEKRQEAGRRAQESLRKTHAEFEESEREQRAVEDGISPLTKKPFYGGW